MGHVVIAGHCTIDDIHQADGTFLPVTPGGAAAYATLGAIMYGARVTVISPVGDDYPLDRFRSGLAGHGEVDLRRVRRAEARSIHNSVWYRPDGARNFDIESWEVMERLTPIAADLAAATIGDAVVLLTPGSLDKQLEAVRHVRSLGRDVAVDTEIHYFPTETGREVLRRVIAAASFYLASIEHLQRLFGRPDRDYGAYFDELLKLGCPWIVVKQGAAGCVLIDCRQRRGWTVPAVPNITVKDPTGAGDGFSGGFMAALADGQEPLNAACWGSVTASFVVESIGAIMPAHFDPQLAARRHAALAGRVRPAGYSETTGGNAARDS